MTDLNDLGIFVFGLILGALLLFLAVEVLELWLAHRARRRRRWKNGDRR